MTVLFNNRKQKHWSTKMKEKFETTFALFMATTLLACCILLTLSTTERGDCINGHVNNTKECLIKIVGGK